MNIFVFYETNRVPRNTSWISRRETTITAWRYLLRNLRGTFLVLSSSSNLLRFESRLKRGRETYIVNAICGRESILKDALCGWQFGPRCRGEQSLREQGGRTWGIARDDLAESDLPQNCAFPIPSQFVSFVSLWGILIFPENYRLLRMKIFY